MIQEAAIGVGSNVGARAEQIYAAQRALEATAGIEDVQVASLIATAPVLEEADASHPAYFNTVFVLKTSLSAEALMARLLAVEASFGRRRDGAISPRTIDLDLLLLGDEVRSSPALTLPHPRIGERTFVLDPLRELRPSLAKKYEALPPYCR